MKNLNLENYGVQEMNEKEMMNVDDGYIGLGPLWWNAGLRAAMLSRWGLINSQFYGQNGVFVY